MTDGTGVVSHAGTVLLAELADRIGLTAALSEATDGLRERRAGHDPGRAPSGCERYGCNAARWSTCRGDRGCSPSSQACRPRACPGTRSCHPRRTHVHGWGIDILLATREASDTGAGPAQGSFGSRLPRGMTSERSTTGQLGPIAPYGILMTVS
jgi:hypothetical protein